MSAFVMNEKGFVALADEFASRAESHNNVCDLSYCLSDLIRGFLGFKGGCFNAPDDAHPEASLAAQEFYDLNVRAVNERYGEQETATQLSFVRHHRSPGWLPVQLYKNLRCLLYQMSEGDVPETETYKRLAKLTEDIGCAIVENSNDYKQASWGWYEKAAAA